MKLPDKRDPNDRFGVPEQLIIDVIRAHRGLMRDGCYVPTRHEVTTREPFWLTLILLGWWWESPSELIPTDEQVAAVIAVLRSRPDADHWVIQELIAQAPPRRTANEGSADSNRSAQ
jgi:hypothetical protein